MKPGDIRAKPPNPGISRRFYQTRGYAGHCYCTSPKPGDTRIKFVSRGYLPYLKAKPGDIRVFPPKISPCNSRTNQESKYPWLCLAVVGPEIDPYMRVKGTTAAVLRGIKGGQPGLLDILRRSQTRYRVFEAVVTVFRGLWGYVRHG